VEENVEDNEPEPMDMDDYQDGGYEKEEEADAGQERGDLHKPAQGKDNDTGTRTSGSKIPVRIIMVQRGRCSTSKHPWSSTIKIKSDLLS
jgi:hypothetical protein